MLKVIDFAGLVEQKQCNLRGRSHRLAEGVVGYMGKVSMPFVMSRASNREDDKEVIVSFHFTSTKGGLQRCHDAVVLKLAARQPELFVFTPMPFSGLGLM